MPMMANPGQGGGQPAQQGGNPFSDWMNAQLMHANYQQQQGNQFGTNLALQGAMGYGSQMQGAMGQMGQGLQAAGQASQAMRGQVMGGDPNNPLNAAGGDVMQYLNPGFRMAMANMQKSQMGQQFQQGSLQQLLGHMQNSQGFQDTMQQQPQLAQMQQGIQQGWNNVNAGNLQRNIPLYGGLMNALMGSGGSGAGGGYGTNFGQGLSVPGGGFNFPIPSQF